MLMRKKLIVLAVVSAALSVVSCVRGENLDEEVEVFGNATQLSSSTSANAVCIDGNTLFMGDAGHVYVYDLSTSRSNPALVATINLPGLVRQMVARNGMLYTANRDTGVYIYNVSDPANPVFVRRYDSVELATGIDLAGDVLYVGQRQNGVEIIDVTDPSRAAHIDIIPTPESQSCFYKNGYVYSGEWGAGQVSVIDVRDMNSISLVKKVNLQGYGDGVYASGNLLFVSTGHHHKNETPKTQDGDGHGMEIFDISAPDNPKFLSRVEFGIFFVSGRDYWTCRPSGDGKTVFCADTGNGAYAVDISDPSKARIIDHYVSPGNHTVTSIAVSDGYVYIAAYEDGLYAVRSPKAVAFTRDDGVMPANISARKEYVTPAGSAFNAWIPAVRSQVHSAAAYGDALFVACGDGGLSIVKRKDDGTLYQYAAGPSGFAGDVKVRGNKLFVAEGVEGMAIYTISEGPSLSLFKRVSDLGAGSACNIALWMFVPNGKFVVVGTRYRGYVFMGAAGTPDNPNFTRRLQKNWYNAYNKFIPDEVCVGDQLPFITKYGVAWIDLGDPTGVPAVLGPYVSSVTTLSEGISNYKDGRAIYPHKGQLRILESKGQADAEVSASLSSYVFGIPRWDGADRILMSGTLARKVSVVNVSAFPAIVGELLEQTSGQPEAGIFWKGKAVVPCGYQGLLVEI